MLRILCILPVLLAQAALAKDCDVAKALLKAGQFTEAHSAYGLLLKTNPIPACAPDGYIDAKNRLVDNALTTSKKHLEIGDYIAAVDSYEAALALVSDKTGGSRAHLSGLADLKAEAAKGLIERAREQTKKGATDLALASYTKVLEYDPDNPEAQRGISEIRQSEKLAEVRVMAALGDFAGAVKAIGEASGDNPGLYTEAVATIPGLSRFTTYQRYYEGSKQIAIFAILIFIAVFLFYRICARYLSTPALAFELFDTKSIEQDIGKPIDKVIKAYMDDLTRGSVGGDVGVTVAQTVEKIEIPSAIAETLPPQLSFATAIPALVQMIFPRRVRNVTGSLHFTESLGCGITVNLESPGGSALKGYTFWQKNYEPKNGNYGSKPGSTAPYFDLCQYVAIWLLYAIDAKDRFRPLGCNNWSAYVSFRNGVIETFKSDPDTKYVKACYVRALNLQPTFNAPRYNLALQAKKHQYELTLKPLLHAAESGDPNDPTKYNARYKLANRLYQLNKRDCARKQVGILVKEIEKKIPQLRSKAKQSARAQLFDRNRDPMMSFLEVSWKVAKSMHIGLSILIDKDISLVKELMDLREMAITPRAHYNIACGYSLAAQVVRENPSLLLTAGAAPEKIDSLASVEKDGSGETESIAVADKGKDAEENEVFDKSLLSHENLIKDGLMSLQTATFMAPEYYKKFQKDPSLEELRVYGGPILKEALATKPASSKNDADAEEAGQGEQTTSPVEDFGEHVIDLLKMWLKPGKTKS